MTRSEFSTCPVSRLAIISTRSFRLYCLMLFVLASHPGFALDTEEILQKVTAAHGGLEKLQSIETLQFEVAGYRISRHQSRHVEPPWDRVPVRSFVAIDYASDFGVSDGVGNYPGGLIFPFRSIIGPDGELSLDTEQKTYSRGMSMSSITSLKTAASRSLPPLLVRAMNRNSGSLQLVGEREHLGIRYLELELGSTRILVHPETFLVYATARNRDDMATNDSLEEMRIYAEYESIDGMPFARSLFDYLPQEQTFVADFRLTRLKLNAEISAFMNIPDGFVEGGNPHAGYGNDGELQVRKIGPGVFLAGDNGTNILYVEFDDYFVAMEAGGMAWYAEQVYEAMQEHMNGKPLRYIVPTHYHDDHAVGLRFYAQLGATVLTTPEKAGYLRELLRPVDNGRLLDELQFEWIEGDGRSFRDPSQQLDVRVYTDSPHSENMLVGYLPGLNAIFSADMFVGWGGTDEIRQGASYGLKHFSKWLEAHVERGNQAIELFLPVHGRPYTRAEIRAMLSREKTFVVLPDNREVSAQNWFRSYGLDDETINGRGDVMFDR